MLGWGWTILGQAHEAQGRPSQSSVLGHLAGHMDTGQPPRIQASQENKIKFWRVAAATYEASAESNAGYQVGPASDCQSAMLAVFIVHRRVKSILITEKDCVHYNED